MKKTYIPIDEALCAVCGKPAGPGEPTMAHPEKDTFVHGRCYDAEMEKPKPKGEVAKLRC